MSILKNYMPKKLYAVARASDDRLKPTNSNAMNVKELIISTPLIDFFGRSLYRLHKVPCKNKRKL